MCVDIERERCVHTDSRVLAADEFCLVATDEEGVDDTVSTELDSGYAHVGSVDRSPCAKRDAVGGNDYLACYTV